MKNKKVLLGLAIVLLTILALVFLRGPEDDWICDNGQWVKHGNPSRPKPDRICD